MKNRELLIWQGESGLWLVAHPWLDIISQGTTREQAVRSFYDTVALMTLHTVDKDGCAKLRVATPEVSADWARKAALEKSKAS